MSTDVTKEKLVADLKIVVKDAEALLRDAGEALGDKAAVAKEKLQTSLKEAKAKLIEAERIAVDKAKHAAKATDEYVHENPWQAVGIAAGVGFLVGLLIRRR